MAISQDERDFFVELGSRLAALRRDSHLTQVQMAETLGVAQPTLNASELGQRRVSASASALPLPLLAKLLGVNLKELMGEPATQRSKHGPTPKQAQHMERISQLPKPQQRFVMQVIESVIAQQGR